MPSCHIESMKKAVAVCKRNFSERNSSAYCCKEGININHTVQYSLFLYYFSHQLYIDRAEDYAGKVYYLNKIMHANDWFYATDLPIHFGADCAWEGSIWGLFIYQGVNVGGNIDALGNLHYPVLEDHILMFSDSKILGHSHIGRYVIFSANSYVINEDIPDYSIVFGQSPNLICKSRSESEISKYFDRLWKK